MDTDITGVTLPAQTVNDLLALYRDRTETLARPLFGMAAAYDLSKPDNPVPLQLYNDLCQWVEQRLGPASLQNVGLQISLNVYANMLKLGLIHPPCHPVHMLQGLQKIAAAQINDAKQRGWVLLDVADRSVILQRTMPFNKTLQLGLLKGLLLRSTALLPEIRLLREVSNGDTYDEYFVHWQGLKFEV
jgi:hypothetical protein